MSVLINKAHRMGWSIVHFTVKEMFVQFWYLKNRWKKCAALGKMLTFVS